MRIMLGVEPDLGVPRRLRDIQRHIGTRRLERRERKHEPRFLAQFPRPRSGRILARLPGTRWRRPRPIAREIRAEVSAVEDQELAAGRVLAPNHDTGGVPWLSSHGKPVPRRFHC